MSATSRPILFSAAMVRAILNGSKSQTRRVITPQPTKPVDGIAHIALMPPKANGEYEELWWKNGGHLVGPVPGPRYFKGQVLWVREAWRVRADLDGVKPRDLAPSVPWYCATGSGFGDEEPSGCAGGLGKKRPGMFMPRWASRITLVVTDVRVQRLQEISEEDAKAEGITEPKPIMGTAGYVAAFSYLWDEINGKRWPWTDSNPWVWAITFRRVA